MTFMMPRHCNSAISTVPGYNNIAIEAAAACGIPVTTGPGVNAASVAEGALMSMLMIARRVRTARVWQTYVDYLARHFLACLDSSAPLFRLGSSRRRSSGAALDFRWAPSWLEKRWVSSAWET